MDDFLITLTVMATIYGVIHLLVRRKERMALIEKGQDASILAPSRNIRPSLTYGLLLAGIGLGTICGNILFSTGAMHEEPAYFSMIFLFGGVALLLNYFLQHQRAPKQ
ncbi:MAG: hypothetical protein JW861_09320 [Bacteroidales bacterium]|nr:hypothetical protein [Bacteroidales bacterium]